MFKKTTKTGLKSTLLADNSIIFMQMLVTRLVISAEQEQYEQQRGWRSGMWHRQ